MSKPVVDPRAEAMKYLEQHRLLTLFDILGAKLAKEKPENPNDFILEELGRIAQIKAGGNPVSGKKIMHTLLFPDSSLTSRTLYNFSCLPC